MQFREIGGRIQCLSAYYDHDCKRTRQKLVISLPRYGLTPRSVHVDQLKIGTLEEREKWQEEINEFLAKQNKAQKAESDKRQARHLVRTADQLVQVLTEMPDFYPADELRQVRNAMRRLRNELDRRKVSRRRQSPNRAQTTT
jgi:predicted component of type VI protein secretion system